MQKSVGVLNSTSSLKRTAVRTASNAEKRERAETYHNKDAII